MKLLLYCTKAKPNLWDNYEYAKYMYRQGYKEDRYCIGNKVSKNDSTYKYCEPYMDKVVNLNEKIVAECDFEVEKIEYDWYPCDILPIGEHYYTYYHTKSISTAKEFYSKSCLDWDKLNQYLNDYDSQKFEGGYAIHIKNLHIFDKPKELSEYGTDFPISPIVKAPQNMMYANGIGERYILISIRPEWLCKILNGEKTIEVRKKVLKEMLE